MFLSTSGYACTVDLVLRGNAACMVQAAGTPLDGGVEAAVAELAEEAGQLRVGAVLWGNALCVLPEHLLCVCSSTYHIHRGLYLLLLRSISGNAT